MPRRCARQDARGFSKPSSTSFALCCLKIKIPKAPNEPNPGWQTLTARCAGVWRYSAENATRHYKCEKVRSIAFRHLRRQTMLTHKTFIAQTIGLTGKDSLTKREKIREKVPILQNVSTLSVLVFSFFEYVLYWGTILGIAALLQSTWRQWKKLQQRQANAA